MKPIGPYVAVQALPPPATGVAAADSSVQTLRATDRLTGIPVLLHLLPHAQSLPELPFSPHLLPVVDSGVDGEVTYLVTELPLQAHPASDPLLSARGALAALSALHQEGLAHGGVSGTQLWNHDGGVALAGAGLPWRKDATPQADLSDLAVTLQALGALPEVLRPLRDRPGTLSAHAALALLGGAVGREAGAMPPPDQPAPPVEGARVRPLPAGASGAGPAGSVSPAVREAAATQPHGTAAPDVQPSPAAGSPSTGESSGAPRTETAGTDTGPPSAAVSPFSNAPAGQPETPQERRKRQNDERREQALLDSQAAAVRKAARLKAQREEEEREMARAAELSALGVPVPEPFQMGFDLEGEGGEAATNASPSGLRAREVERLPASLRRPAARQTDAAVQRLPGGDSASPRPAARNLAPIRIGWDEDDSWRVVRAAPKAGQSPSRLLLIPIVLAVAALLGAGLLWALRPEASTPTPAGTAASVSSDVVFTLRGAAGVTARLSVVSAPSGANLKADQALGVIPGKISFPVQGTYQLKVLAQGYQPATLEVTVPRTQPVTIDLGN
ncbi:hypothetical protein GCM10010840_02060 [Deinococcus aerolatus]|uniref:PEGA domain-containing protein n=1 Tax=Deinococcus aerolatus TaxID=522487 RepID=A0ABQ2G068_9DEIO|nr:PEGA domain-containing protein [Deinococcus aerolatus]GGL67612.1 hypothetical protein GCM10010840_02060 [Deinococcus aerolatus]